MNNFVVEYDLLEINDVAKKIVSFLPEISVVTLTGTLGAGKTTLVAALLKELGIIGPVISPTFTYVNRYQLSDGFVVYHFDLYRLEDLSSFIQAGFDEYLYQDKVICFIEWPEIALPLLYKNVCHISIEFDGLDKRRLACRAIKQGVFYELL